MLPLHILQWHTVQHAAIDFLEIRTEVHVSETGQRGGRFLGTPKWTRVDGIKPRLALQPLAEEPSLLLAASTERKVRSALENGVTSHSAIATGVRVSNEHQSKRQVSDLMWKECMAEAGCLL
jgi:hypothetical protein